MSDTPAKQSETYEDEKGNEKPVYFPADYAEVEFPIAIAKPQVVAAVGTALKRKIFDELGVLPARRKGDPMVIGRIIDKSHGYAKEVSFLVTWWIDTSDL